MSQGGLPDPLQDLPDPRDGRDSADVSGERPAIGRPAATQPSALDRYPPAMRLLHWVRAGLVFGMIALGWYMASLPADGAGKYDLYPTHKAFGMIALAVVLIALTVRLRSAHPAASTAIGRWERLLSLIVHRLLIVLTVLVPVAGYDKSSAFPAGDGIPFFGLHLPRLVPPDQYLAMLFVRVHSILAYTLLGVAVLHIAGALKHRFLDRDADVVRRML